jgi:toxin HigB-1
MLLQPGKSVKAFEALPGDRKGQYSIRINDQWRIRVERADDPPRPSNLEIVDYH